MRIGSEYEAIKTANLYKSVEGGSNIFLLSCSKVSIDKVAPSERVQTFKNLWNKNVSSKNLIPFYLPKFKIVQQTKPLSLIYVTPLPFLQYSPFTEFCIQLALVFQKLKAILKRPIKFL